jgi:chromosome segregation ATPase
MMYGRKGLEPLAMPMAAWLAWLESASSMWSAMSIPATAPAQLQELQQINGRLTAERDALLAAAGTLDESRSKVAELQAVAQAAECARDEAAQRLAAILRESEAAQRKLDDARSEAVARAAEAETHVAARDMARSELQELQQKSHETEQKLAQLQAVLTEVQDAIAGREAAEQARDGAAAELAALRHDVYAARRDLDDAISQASARRGEAAEHLAAGAQARAELLAVQSRCGRRRAR